MIAEHTLPQEEAPHMISHMEAAPVTSQAFWTELVRQTPEFADRYQRELEIEGGELLTHCMFGVELVPYVESLLRTPTDAIRSASGRNKRKRGRRSADYDQQLANDDVLRRLLSCVETGLSNGDHHLREAILVSFIENLAKHERSETIGNRELARLRALLGPNLQAGWKALQQWLDQPYWDDKAAEYRWIRWKPVES